MDVIDTTNSNHPLDLFDFDEFLNQGGWTFEPLQNPPQDPSLNAAAATTTTSPPSYVLPWDENAEAGGGEDMAELEGEPGLEGQQIGEVVAGVESSVQPLQQDAGTATDLMTMDEHDAHMFSPLAPAMAAPPSPTIPSVVAEPLESEEGLHFLLGSESGEEDSLPSAPDLIGIAPIIPPVFSNIPSNPMHLLRSLNPSMKETFDFWRRMSEMKKRGYPSISTYKGHRGGDLRRPARIAPAEMKKSGCDMQGIPWDRYGVTRKEAREVRRMVYYNYTNMEHDANQDQSNLGCESFKTKFATVDTPALPATDHRYRFRTTHTTCLPHWKHYQLRHNIFASSQNAVYYHTSPFTPPYMDPMTSLISHSRHWSVSCFDPHTSTSTPVMSPTHIPDESSPRLDGISTLSASHNILVVGSVTGVYGLRSLLTPPTTPITVDTIALAPPSELGFGDNSTNHVYTYLSRTSNTPLAVFSSNDRYIRTLDTETQTWLAKHRFPSAVNCAASDPTSRLRILVSDDKEPIIADAETGEILYRLTGHQDHGFACAWADDGYTVATGHQDGIVQIYDARFLRSPSAVFGVGGDGGGDGGNNGGSGDGSGPTHRIPSSQSCVRSLQFSPLGTGPPVLVAAEPADFVHVIDAGAGDGAFAKQQDIEFFGDVAGVSLSPDGRTLWIGCADGAFGGLMEFERRGCGRYEEEGGMKQMGMGGRGRGRRQLGRRGRGKEVDMAVDVDMDMDMDMDMDSSDTDSNTDDTDVDADRGGRRRRRGTDEWIDPLALDDDARCLSNQLGRFRRGFENELAELIV